MTVSYDTFVSDFLQKITEYNFLRFDNELREKIVDGYTQKCHQVGEFSKSTVFVLLVILDK